MQTTQSQSDVTRDQIREQIRQQIRAARDEARAAVRGELAQVPEGVPVPPLPPDVPGAVTETWTMQPPTGPHVPDIPPGVQDVAISFFVMMAVIIVGFPLARAIGRRIEGRAPTAAALPSPDLTSQLHRIEQAVDAMAIEVERISESQRYLTRLQSEREAIPAGKPRA